MDPSYPNNYFNLGDPNDYSPSLLFSNPVEDFVTQSPQSSQNVGKESRANKSDAAEDIALMSAWCFASENKIRGKNQKKEALWSQVKNLYEAAQKENPQKIGMRNENQMRGRLNDLTKMPKSGLPHIEKHIGKKKSGMSLKDKWDLQLNYDTTRSRPECEVGNEESGGSTKRSRTNEEGDYCVNSNPDLPINGGSTIKRSTGRDSDKKKGKCKAYNEFAEELRAMRVTRDSEIELMRKRVELEQQRVQYRQERDQKKQETERENMQLLHLNTLLAKESLSPEEVDMKRYLMAKFYGN
ncbi:hypothetical protein E3N88_33950 [Mikania micrantha]|uniref:No apical meristem-associated C-terminal domain-containing protein n=1 Tax=Mikania micrantha TaxID=192012 RepID=A0A5N6MCQ8_9ASTR|nr:hypothetical protein E3N88_33950 [Mikania micrantha]